MTAGSGKCMVCNGLIWGASGGGLVYLPGRLLRFGVEVRCIKWYALREIVFQRHRILEEVLGRKGRIRGRVVWPDCTQYTFNLVMVFLFVGRRHGRCCVIDTVNGVLDTFMHFLPPLTVHPAKKTRIDIIAACNCT